MEVDRGSALKRIRAMLKHLDDDTELFCELVDALREKYEELDNAIAELRTSENFEAVTYLAQEFTSGIRYALDPSLVDAANELSAACRAHDRAKIYSNWVALHKRLYPLLVVMRDFSIDAR